MRTLSFVIVVGALFSTPVYAAVEDTPAANNKAKIEKLEQEIKGLREELHLTREQYSALKARLDDIRSIVGSTTTINEAQQKEFGTQLCFDSISKLKETRIKLKNMGYKDEHPDAANVTRALNKRMIECGIEPTDVKTSGN